MINSVKALSATLILAVFSIAAYAQTKVVIIPMSGDDLKPLANIVTVAKGNGDFANPVDAINSIPLTGDGAPSAMNPYLIVIAPGVYTLSEPLIMKEYVSIDGAGQNSTFLTGAISTSDFGANSAIISGKNNTHLSNLSVTNMGENTYSMAIYNSSASPYIERVTATVSGDATINYGILNISSSPTINNVKAIAKGSRRNYGVYNSDSSSPVMTQVTATASRSANNFGIYNNSSSPTMIQVTATALGSGWGLYNSGRTSNPVIRESSLSGPTGGVWISGIKTRIINTLIVGSVFDDHTTSAQCRSTYNADLANVTC